MYNFGSGVNTAQRRDVYPSASGATGGQVGGVATVGGNTNPAVSNVIPQTQVSTSGGTSVIFWVALVGLFIALRFASEKWGSGNFGNIKSSVYNILFVTFSAIIGLGFVKSVSAKYPIRGLNEVIQAA